MREKRQSTSGRCWPRRSASATPRPTRPSTSTASTPPTSPRSLARSPSACRCSSTRRMSKASPTCSGRHPYAEQLGYRIKLLGITQAHSASGIELRVHPTLVPIAAPDRQRRRRDERGAGQGRRRRNDALLRQGRGRRADRLGGDRRPGRHRPACHRRSRPPRAAPRVPADAMQDLPCCRSTTS